MIATGHHGVRHGKDRVVPEDRLPVVPCLCMLLLASGRSLLPSDDELSASVTRYVFREALHYAASHAGARPIEVTVALGAYELTREGSGPRPDLTEEAVRHGRELRMMRVRAEAIGGRLFIQSQEWTRVRHELPRF